MTELKINLESPEMAVIIIEVVEELRKAEAKHPDWPIDNIFEQVSIISEEAGEIAKAVNDRDLLGAKTEAKQTIAVCLRFLLNLEL